MEKRQINVPADAKITLNELGNVSKVEMEKVLSSVQGQLKHTFHYRIEKEANVSTNDETGESFPVYCKVQIEYENPMSEETLNYAHMHYATQVSKENNIPFEYITPISEEQYEFQMLYGIATDLQNKIVNEGYKLRLYIPYGDDWFGYFMRRLAERPANVWFVLKNLVK